ncbi:MAG: hypothetical protein J2P21_05125 [Chloracidobacterium sp.]|nr:hypothetical protein [Chloracidobacterium sp.]
MPGRNEKDSGSGIKLSLATNNENSMRSILSSLLSFFGVSRKDKSQESKVTNAKFKLTDIDSLNPGSIRHQSLNHRQMERIYKLRDTLAEVERSPIEKWIDDFKRDLNPDKELAVWERIADGYARYCSRRPLSIEAKEDVFQLLLLRSMASEREVLDNIKLKILTLDEARETLKEF